jgi:hypothetical protein
MSELPMLHTEEDLALDSPVGFESVGDDHTLDVGQSLEEFAKELLRGLFVLPPLQQVI